MSGHIRSCTRALSELSIIVNLKKKNFLKILELNYSKTNNDQTRSQCEYEGKEIQAPFNAQQNFKFKLKL